MRVQRKDGEEGEAEEEAQARHRHNTHTARSNTTSRTLNNKRATCMRDNNK